MFNLPTPKTIIEPFRIKSVEPLPLVSIEERQLALEKAGYNLFNLPADKVSFDLLTDSGTSAMSSRQWAGIMEGDESYAGSKSFLKFEKVVGDMTGLKHVIPTHQGRSAEALLMSSFIKPGQVVIGNTHFDTTRANIENAKAVALDMPCVENENSDFEAPFKGNINIEELDQYLKENHNKVGLLIMTVTNNSVGGQPVSIKNIKQTKELLSGYNIPLFLDCARFAEIAYFIKIR